MFTIHHTRISPEKRRKVRRRSQVTEVEGAPIPEKPSHLTIYLHNHIHIHKRPIIKSLSRKKSLTISSPASSRTPKRLPLTMALAGGDDEMGQGPATVYVGPWSECQLRHQEKRDTRDTRMREPKVTLPRSLPPLPGPPPASPHFPLPWLPASSPSPSGPSSPAPELGERQRNVVCRSTVRQKVYHNRCPI